MRFVAGRLGDEAHAKDIIQDAFVHVWRKRALFHDENHLRGYIYKTLYSNTLKFIEGARRRSPLSSVSQIGGDDIFASIIEVEVKRQVTQAIASLPAEQRKVILLALSGLTVGQIAARLGISANTVKTQKKRAYSKLRKDLE